MAIARDAAAFFTQASGTTLTYSHTCTGSDLVLIAAGFCNGSKSVSGITYNGVAMTAIATATYSTDTIRAFYLINPDTGAHNVVVTFSATTNGEGGNSQSFTGAKQSGQPDASVTRVVGETTVTATLTVVADGSYCLVFGRGQQSGPLNASTNCTNHSGTSDQVSMYDSNGTVSAGSFAMTQTSNGSNDGFALAVSVAPVPAVGPANMKTQNGLASASVKTLNGLAIASVKTYDGLA